MKRFLPLSVLGVLLVSGNLVAEVQRPLYARPATTTQGFNMDVYAEYFDGLALQEARSLEGWTAGFDFTFPFNDAMQLRFLLPVRTEAQGVLRNSGEDIDIEGWGGTFRFATVFFEHQLVGVDGGRHRFAYFLGAGHRTSVLETDTLDRYNHRGRSLHLGARYDRVLSGGGTLLLDTELRFYEESDDLNPGNLDDDSFFLGRITGGWVGARKGSITPALEITADLSENHSAVALVPEAFVRAGSSLDVKLGLPVGLTSDAPEWGAQLRLTVSLGG